MIYFLGFCLVLGIFHFLFTNPITRIIIASFIIFITWKICTSGTEKKESSSNKSNSSRVNYSSLDDEEKIIRSFFKYFNNGIYVDPKTIEKQLKIENFHYALLLYLQEEILIPFYYNSDIDVFYEISKKAKYILNVYPRDSFPLYTKCIFTIIENYYHNNKSIRGGWIDFFNDWFSNQDDFKWNDYLEYLNLRNDDLSTYKLFDKFIKPENYASEIGKKFLPEIREKCIENISKLDNVDNYIYYFMDCEYKKIKISKEDFFLFANFKEITSANHSDCLYAYKLNYDLTNGPFNNKKIQSLVHDSENQLREELNLPLIGQGWIAETLLFREIETIFYDLTVLQHYSPDFLTPQHYDIFIKEYNIAIEYQGAQHFEPISIFGGEEGLIKTKERDNKKRFISKDHNVKLIEVKSNYNLEKLVQEICDYINDNKYFNYYQRKVDENFSSTLYEEVQNKKRNLTNISNHSK